MNEFFQILENIMEEYKIEQKKISGTWLSKVDLKVRALRNLSKTHMRVHTHTHICEFRVTFLEVT